MPVPMMEPIPMAIRGNGPKARRRLCSPVSFASARILSNGFVAKRPAICCYLPELWVASASSRPRILHIREGVCHHGHGCGVLAQLGRDNFIERVCCAVMVGVVIARILH